MYELHTYFAIIKKTLTGFTGYQMERQAYILLSPVKVVSKSVIFRECDRVGDEVLELKLFTLPTRIHCN